MKTLKKINKKVFLKIKSLKKTHQFELHDFDAVLQYSVGKAENLVEGRHGVGFVRGRSNLEAEKFLQNLGHGKEIKYKSISTQTHKINTG